MRRQSDGENVSGSDADTFVPEAVVTRFQKKVTVFMLVLALAWAAVECWTVRMAHRWGRASDLFACARRAPSKTGCILAACAAGLCGRGRRIQPVPEAT